VKKVIVVAIVVGLVAVAWVVGLRKPGGATTAADAPVPVPTLERPLVVPEDAIATVMDLKGIAQALRTYEASCRHDGVQLDYHGSQAGGSWLNGIFEGSPVVPIETASGAFEFVFIDRVDEYRFDGRVATIRLLDGRTLTGRRARDATIKGAARREQVTMPAEELFAAKFNPVLSRSVMDEIRERLGRAVGGVPWPADGAESAELTMKRGGMETLRAPQVVYVVEGCDDNWMPCKPYSLWKPMSFLSLVDGTVIKRVELVFVESLRFLDLPGGRAADVTTRSGKQWSSAPLYVGRDGPSDYRRAIGFVGFTPEGLIYVPLAETTGFRMVPAASDAGSADGGTP
jgi:hypothetical protein